MHASMRRLTAASRLWVTLTLSGAAFLLCVLQAGPAAAHTRCSYNAQEATTWWVRFHDHDNDDFVAYLFHDQRRRQVRLDVVASNPRYFYRTQLRVVCTSDAEPQTPLQATAWDADLRGADLTWTCPSGSRITEVAAWLDSSEWNLEPYDEATEDQQREGHGVVTCDGQGTLEARGRSVPSRWW